MDFIIFRFTYNCSGYKKGIIPNRYLIMACGVRSFYYGREFLSIRPGIPGGIRLIAKDSLAAFILGAVFS